MNHEIGDCVVSSKGKDATYRHFDKKEIRIFIASNIR